MSGKDQSTRADDASPYSVEETKRGEDDESESGEEDKDGSLSREPTMSSEEEEDLNDEDLDLSEEDDDNKEEIGVADNVIAAIAPQIVRREGDGVEGEREGEGQGSGMSSTPVLQVLNDLLSSGRLSGTQTSFLKSKYNEFLEALKSKRENEQSLLTRAKMQTTELEGQREQLEKSERFPGAANTEVSKMREQLLKYNNSIMEAEELYDQLQYQLSSLRDEKAILEREYSRMPKSGEVEKKVEELKQSHIEMRKEIGHRQMEAKRLKEDIDNRNWAVIIKQKELERAGDEIDTLKAELVDLQSKPGQMSKENDKLQREKHETREEILKFSAELKKLSGALEEVRARQVRLVDDKNQLETKNNREVAIQHSMDKDYQVLHEECESMRECVTVILGDRLTTDTNLKHMNAERKHLHEILGRKTREKEEELKNLANLERQLRTAEDSLNVTKQQLDKAKIRFEEGPKVDESFQKNHKELEKTREQLEREMSKQNSLTTLETIKVEQSVAEEDRLLFDQSDLRVEVVELSRLAAIKNDEREQKARDFMRAEQRFRRAVEEVKTKQLELQDHQKKYHQMQARLKDFAKLYDIMKGERNKCVSLIQASAQKASEMREKVKIMQNEAEILRTASSSKEKDLQRGKFKLVAAVMLKDNLRNELLREQRIVDQLEQEHDKEQTDVARLNQLVDQGEEELVRLHKLYEAAVRHRNDRGVLLIERNEEVCIFYEKLNVQENLLRNGNIELQEREEEVRFLRMQRQEEERRRDNARKRLPNKRVLGRELVDLQIQLAQCEDKKLELEKLLENPNNEGHVRFLDGKDPPADSLKERIEELDLRLLKKEELSLEKDLVLSQTEKLVERIRKKAETGKDDTLALAKKINELQSRIRRVTRKMMAMVSELSMHQASAMRLQQQVKDSESQLEQCYMRMEKGEPPNESIEQEWRKVVEVEERRKSGKRLAQFAEQIEESIPPGGLISTAQPRPQAYISQDDSDLPIPRPYGSHAPFKASEPGSNMRHIRKPIPKSIEI